MRFDIICFTGSTQKGKLVAGSAAKNLVPCILELGGKSPAILDESCDPDLVAKFVLFAKMTNTGQICISTDYLMCHESKLDAFMTSFKREVEHAYSDGREELKSGKIVTAFHYKRLCGMLENHGGTVLHGNANSHKDMHLKPTVILNPNKDSTMMKEEIFGPIIPIITYKHVDEAIKYIVEEQEKPLVVYFYGKKNCANQHKVAAETSSGTFVVNSAIV